MKMSDLEKVNFLVGTKQKCLKALEQAKEHHRHSFNDKDVGGIPRYEYGYSANFSFYHDGSSGIDMNGCYIGVEVTDAIRQILIVQIDKIDNDLMKLGVTFDEDSE